MTTVVTVCKRKVHALIISQIHGSADQCTDGFFIVADGITYILDLTTIAKLPETSLQILFLDWGYVLCYMTVETVAYIWSVRNPFNNSVHLTELLYLQATETLCRRSVDCVKVTVFLLILIYLVIDIFQNFQGKSTILCNGFSIVKLLQLVECCDTKGSSHRLQDLADLFIWFQMSAVETTLTVRKRVGRRTHLSQILIRTDMQITDHFQIEIQNFIEISALRSGLGKDHRKMKAYRTDVKTAHKNRRIILICRFHATTLIPRA